MGQSRRRSTKMGEPMGQSRRRSTKMGEPMGQSRRRSTKMGEPMGQSRRRSTKMGEPMGQSRRRSTKMGEPMSQSRRRSTKMGEPRGQSRRRNTKMAEPMGQSRRRSTKMGEPMRPPHTKGPAQEHQSLFTDSSHCSPPLFGDTMGEPMAPEFSQEHLNRQHQNGRSNGPDVCAGAPKWEQSFNVLEPAQELAFHEWENEWVRACTGACKHVENPFALTARPLGASEMGEPMGQSRRRSTKMGEPMDQSRRRSTKKKEPRGQGPAQEHQNGRTIASSTHQGAGAGFPKLIHRQHPLQHPLFGEKWENPWARAGTGAPK